MNMFTKYIEKYLKFKQIGFLNILSCDNYLSFLLHTYLIILTMKYQISTRYFHIIKGLTDISKGYTLEYEGNSKITPIMFII